MNDSQIEEMRNFTANHKDELARLNLTQAHDKLGGAYVKAVRDSANASVLVLENSMFFNRDATLTSPLGQAGLELLGIIQSKADGDLQARNWTALRVSAKDLAMVTFFHALQTGGRTFAERYRNATLAWAAAEIALSGDNGTAEVMVEGLTLESHVDGDITASPTPGGSGFQITVNATHPPGPVEIRTRLFATVTPRPGDFPADLTAEISGPVGQPGFTVSRPQCGSFALTAGAPSADATCAVPKEFFFAPGEYVVKARWSSAGEEAYLRGTFFVSVSGGAPPPEFVQCNDGVDNDGDGLIDAADPGCSDTFTDNDETDPVQPPPGVPACRDGQDNDGDGKYDHPSSPLKPAGKPHDPGCTTLEDDDEFDFAPPPPQCRDGFDNDGDGRVDHAASSKRPPSALPDPGCDSTEDNDESNPTMLAKVKVIDNTGAPVPFASVSVSVSGTGGVSETVNNLTDKDGLFADQVAFIAPSTQVFATCQKFTTGLSPGLVRTTVSSASVPELTCQLLKFGPDTAILSGTVFDLNHKPLQGVVVTAGGVPTLTSATGGYSMRVTTGEHTVRFEKAGFAVEEEPATVPLAAGRTVDAVMRRSEFFFTTSIVEQQSTPIQVETFSLQAASIARSETLSVFSEALPTLGRGIRFASCTSPIGVLICGYTAIEIGQQTLGWIWDNFLASDFDVNAIRFPLRDPLRNLKLELVGASAVAAIVSLKDVNAEANEVFNKQSDRSLRNFQVKISVPAEIVDVGNLNRYQPLQDRSGKPIQFKITLSRFAAEAPLCSRTLQQLGASGLSRITEIFDLSILDINFQDVYTETITCIALKDAYPGFPFILTPLPRSLQGLTPSFRTVLPAGHPQVDFRLVQPNVVGVHSILSGDLFTGMTSARFTLESSPSTEGRGLGAVFVPAAMTLFIGQFPL